MKFILIFLLGCMLWGIVGIIAKTNENTTYRYRKTRKQMMKEDATEKPKGKIKQVYASKHPHIVYVLFDNGTLWEVYRNKWKCIYEEKEVNRAE